MHTTLHLVLATVIFWVTTQSACAQSDCSALEGKYSNAGTQTDQLTRVKGAARLSDRTRYAGQDASHFTFSLVGNAAGYTLRLFNDKDVEVHQDTTPRLTFKCEDGRLVSHGVLMGSGDGNPTRNTSTVLVYKDSGALVIETMRSTESLRLIAPSAPTSTHNVARFSSIAQ